MEIRRGVSSLVVLFATFLTLASLLRTSHAQAGGGRRRERPGSGLTLVTQPEHVYYVGKKTPANITCEALGSASVTISFTCGGALVPPSSQDTYDRYDEARGQTLIRSSIRVTRADVSNHHKRIANEGKPREDYSCECVAEDPEIGVNQRSRRAIVRHAFMRKQFQEEPASQTAALGSRVVFKCVPPRGEPTPEILWRKDGRRISGDRDDNYVVAADGSLTLVIVREQDAGSYECVAKNDAVRRMSEPATLTVGESEEGVSEMMTTGRPESLDEKPVFLEKPPEDIYLTPSQPFPIVCDIQGTNTMTLRCNGQRVTQKDRLTITEDRESKRVRIVFNITYAEVENYVNRLNEDYRTIGRWRDRSAFQCECVAWYRSAAGDRGWGFETSNASNIYLASLEQEFEEEPRALTVQVGSTATLICKPPEGKPRPWVYWVFEQQRLDPRSDPRYRVEGDGSLLIQQVKDSDQGNYYCVAENLVGALNSRMAYLTVSTSAIPEEEEEEELQPTFPSVIPDEPVFTSDLLPEYYLDGEEEVALMCTVVAANQLTFRCDGNRLSEDKQTIDMKTSPDRRTLLLTARTVVTYDDVIQAEDYSCQCVAWYRENEGWQSKVSTSAIITLPYLDAEFVYEPKGTAVSVGESAEFFCQAPEGKPTPKVSWQKDGYTINPEADSNFIVLEDNTLVVEYVRHEDAGLYVCVAGNSAGERFSPPVALEVYGDELESTTLPTPTTTPYVEKSSSTPRDDDYDMMTTTPMMTTSSTEMMMGENQPFFTVMPDESVYIVRGQPVELRCGAMQVSQLLFFCNGERVYAEDEDPSQGVDPTPGLTFFEKSLTVTRDQVLDYLGSEPYTCECRAYHQVDDDQQGEPKYTGTTTVITVAYIRKRFTQSPQGLPAQVGTTVELVCRPPQGVPKPEVHWLKDGFRLEESDNRMVTEEGSLIIEYIETSDAGDYTCVAENIAATRYSETVSVQVVPGATTDHDVVYITSPSSLTHHQSSLYTHPPHSFISHSSLPSSVPVDTHTCLSDLHCSVYAI